MGEVGAISKQRSRRPELASGQSFAAFAFPDLRSQKASQIEDAGDDGDSERASRPPKEQDERDNAERQPDEEQAKNSITEAGDLCGISRLETGWGS